MTWETIDKTVCEFIKAGRTMASADNSGFPVFQEIAAAIDAFQGAGFLENVKVDRESRTGNRHISFVSWTVALAVAAGITSKQRRWLLLRYFAAKAADGHSSAMYSPTPEDFAGLAGNQDRIDQACKWLQEKGCILWATSLSPGGSGSIQECGFEALENGIESLGEGTSAMVQNIDQSTTIGTLNTGGGDVAVGANATINKQMLTDELIKLVEAIKASNSPEGEKRSVLQHLKSALEHPLTVGIAGGIAQSIPGLFLP